MQTYNLITEPPCDRCGIKPTFMKGDEYCAKYMALGDPKDPDIKSLFDEYKDLHVVFCDPDCRLFEADSEIDAATYWESLMMDG